MEVQRHRFTCVNVLLHEYYFIGLTCLDTGYMRIVRIKAETLQVKFIYLTIN